jgi:hypothetical protein
MTIPVVLPNAWSPVSFGKSIKKTSQSDSKSVSPHNLLRGLLSCAGFIASSLAWGSFHYTLYPIACYCRLQFAIFLLTPANICERRVTGDQRRITHRGFRPQQHTHFIIRICIKSKFENPLYPANIILIFVNPVILSKTL